MSDCQVEVHKWRDKDLYVCRPCGISTLDAGSAAARCRATSQEQPLVSSSGLLGPDGEPLPGPDPVHVGGGYYELPDGTRVRGRDEAEKALQPETHDA